ncbi:hypothetical protein SAMN04488506_1456 [Desemzia incerta]|uniref:Uncharacterized protein n=1 Tax=Desemzia incerta TaxID=82801 RepID=A0A1I5XL19_9LACT|nr:hypothetical protein [Desemzia incerta]SFQ32506.1 hypothetical protein SAMN04488506_1456 [Desemzia incerta]
MEKIRKELAIGLFIQAITLITNYYFNIPDLFLGLLQGVALGFMLLIFLPTQWYLRLHKSKSVISKR